MFHQSESRTGLTVQQDIWSITSHPSQPASQPASHRVLCVYVAPLTQCQGIDLSGSKELFASHYFPLTGWKERRETQSQIETRLNFDLSTNLVEFEEGVNLEMYLCMDQCKWFWFLFWEVMKGKIFNIFTSKGNKLCYNKHQRYSNLLRMNPPPPRVTRLGKLGSKHSTTRWQFCCWVTCPNISLYLFCVLLLFPSCVYLDNKKNAKLNSLMPLVLQNSLNPRRWIRRKMSVLLTSINSVLLSSSAREEVVLK